MNKFLVRKARQFPEKQAPAAKTDRSSRFCASYKFPAPNQNILDLCEISQVRD